MQYIIVSPEKATYRDYFGRRRCRRPRPHFLVRSITLSPQVQMTSNLVCMFIAMTWSAVHKNHKLYLVPFFNYFPLIDFYRAFLVRSITLSPQVQMTSNLVCMFIAMTRSAVHKNHNSTLFRFLNYCPLIYFLQSISCPEHNFFTVGPNDFKLGMHLYCNDSECSAQESQL